MSSVTVIIPWGGGCPHRTAALEWVQATYRARFPRWEVVVSEPATKGWVKASAIRRGLEGAREFVVVADADSWCEGVARAVTAVRRGRPWARPHGKVYRLTRKASARVLAGARPSVHMQTERRAYRGTGGGAIVVARRETLLEVPPDRRFVGWGAEDGAWRDALRTLAGMEWDRARAPLFHLFHPSPARHNGRTTSSANRDLAHRYIAARGDRDAMRALVNDG